MKDRELLERAAKAAGYEVHRGSGHQSELLFMRFERPDGLFTAREWNPLADDGDALRLSVKLRLSVMEPAPQDRGNVIALNGRDCASEPWGTDPYAATRRAIVRAAAAMGEV